MMFCFKSRLARVCCVTSPFIHYKILSLFLPHKRCLWSFFILSINRPSCDAEKIDCTWAGQCKLSDQKHLLNKTQKLFFCFLIIPLIAKACRLFFASNWSPLICWNVELQSRLTIWSTGRIRSGPLACALVARYQYRWNNSLIFLQLPIIENKKIAVKALRWSLDHLHLVLLHGKLPLHKWNGLKLDKSREKRDRNLCVVGRSYCLASAMDSAMLCIGQSLSS